ncbi:DUF429 domain-containing protein [Alteromonas macleodii]|uniref:DUF429 domain-containing protein n=1 Tax=Alteromonas macleodii TaxID=28108 RepID=UPI002980F6B8|nr:DUF429 domain-containing protein [Alteromonas macleodii]MDW5286708.1 DUF429 domain-containing protein [Alteromonas macleodii]
MDVFIGIDVACAKGKYLPLVICTQENGRLIPLPLAKYQIKPPRGLGNALTLHDKVNQAFANDVANYIETVCESFHLNPIRIGIDSPLRPRDNNLNRRFAEQALDSSGISCYTTPSTDDFEAIKAKGIAHLQSNKPIQNLPHAHQIFMLLGFALNEGLSKVAECIEVYPHATVKQLGVADIHKSKGNQAELQLSAMSHYTGWPRNNDDWEQADNICLGPMHDRVDAYSAAWVASLSEQERICFGDPEKGDAIWIPKVKPINSPRAKPTTKPKPTTRKKQSVSNAGHQRSCPACHQHEFKRWPFGWDAHAAHRCTGLTEVDPVERKKEFKRRFISS